MPASALSSEVKRCAVVSLILKSGPATVHGAVVIQQAGMVHVGHILVVVVHPAQPQTQVLQLMPSHWCASVEPCH